MIIGGQDMTQTTKRITLLAIDTRETKKWEIEANLFHINGFVVYGVAKDNDLIITDNALYVVNYKSKNISIKIIGIDISGEKCEEIRRIHLVRGKNVHQYILPDNPFNYI